ncbi:LacI family DNA-binding transcriptional regulator [Kocuria sp. SM24M-10]|uniref:LacI family DNA-binding transcriptional regulator n=1 Tax=Kocuria sp. SM24M-10 TaxID=1660349 RepID=UPI00064A415C|nr:LacI family DNA-binding transcriptional regulator [Kocuria sp. SM24M-10]KLU08348.1 hypothetical protein ABL57_18410 [Kocuria sp. SM24M-10]
MQARTTRVTVKDVAAHAGVSVATVSRALNGNRPMSDELRGKVMQSATELGYRVNLLGRALRQQHTGTVGLIVPDLDNPFFAALVEHLSRAAEPAGIDLFVASAGGSLEAEQRRVQSFLGRQMQSLVMIPCDEHNSRASLDAAMAEVVTVQLDRHVLASGALYVGCDNLHGMSLIRDHVQTHVKVSEQPVVFVGADPRSSSAHERLDGFRQHFPDAPVLLGDFNVRWGQRAADELVERGFQRGTVVAAADVIALGLLGRLQSKGFQVPEDFRVIGFDGIGVTPLAYPELTTVRQPVEKMSHTILRLVSEGPESGLQADIRLEPSLVIGRSSPEA